VMTLLAKKRYSSGAIIQMLQNSEDAADQQAYAPMADFVAEVDRPVLVIGGGKSVCRHIEALADYATTSVGLIIHSSKQNLAAFAGVDVPQLLCLSGQEASKFRDGTDQLDASIGLVVSTPPRINPKLQPNWGNLVYEAAPFAPHVHETVIDRGSPLGLALGVAKSVGASNIQLAGFDGYSAESYKATLLGREVQDLLDAFQQMHPDCAIASVTPTLYQGIETHSVYSFLVP